MIKSDSIKTFIFIATTSIGVTLYAHEKFATNKRVDEVVKKQKFQTKVSCLIAIKVNVEKEKLEKMCDIDI